MSAETIGCEKQKMMLALLPAKSRETCEKAWKEFLNYSGFDEETMPTEDDYMFYFQHLRNEKKFKATALWSVYWRLNSMHTRIFGAHLQKWPKLTMVLKGYQGDTLKKADIFTLQQLETFVADSSLSCGYWSVRKAAVCVAYFGGHRMCEMRTINIEDLLETTEGVYISFARAKQRGSVSKTSRYLVPKQDPSKASTSSSVCWASILMQYVARVIQDTNQSSGPLFRTARKFGEILKGAMGVNTLYQIGVEVAQHLNLPSPTKFSGHCFRRTSATHAADRGATTMDMKRHFDWKNDAMPMEYVAKSKAQNKKMAQFLLKSPKKSNDEPLKKNCSTEETHEMDTNDKDPLELGDDLAFPLQEPKIVPDASQHCSQITSQSAVTVKSGEKVMLLNNCVEYPHLNNIIYSGSSTSTSGSSHTPSTFPDHPSLDSLSPDSQLQDRPSPDRMSPDQPSMDCLYQDYLSVDRKSPDIILGLPVSEPPVSGPPDSGQPTSGPPDSEQPTSGPPDCKPPVFEHYASGPSTSEPPSKRATEQTLLPKVEFIETLTTEVGVQTDQVNCQTVTETEKRLLEVIEIMKHENHSLAKKVSYLTIAIRKLQDTKKPKVSHLERQT